MVSFQERNSMGKAGGMGRSVLALGVALALGACGGGSGGNVRPDPPAPPPPSGNDGSSGGSTQPAFDGHLVLTSADRAHAAGYRGAGVTIGFFDTGINRDHPALVGRVLQNFINVDPAGNDLTVDDKVGHGTTVAQLAAARGPARFDWGDVTVSFEGSSTWGNTISGAGGLVKQGGGTLLLLRNSSYSGDTRIEGGTVQLGAGMSGSDFLVGTAGTLRGQGTINADVRNDGHLLVGNQAGDALAIGGDYVHGAGGWLDAWVGSGLRVGGNATLQGGTLNVLGVRTGYTVHARETMLHADVGLSGTFAALTAATGVFLDGTLAYDANNAYLDITRLDVAVAAQSMDLSAASQAGASLVETTFRALDSGVQPAAAASFLQGAGALQSTRSAAGAERSLASLSGELHGADTAFTMMAIEGSRHALESRLDRLGDGMLAGSWAERLDGQRSMW